MPQAGSTRRRGTLSRHAIRTLHRMPLGSASRLFQTALRGMPCDRELEKDFGRIRIRSLEDQVSAARDARETELRRVSRQWRVSKACRICELCGLSQNGPAQRSICFPAEERGMRGMPHGGRLEAVAIWSPRTHELRVPVTGKTRESRMR